MIALKNNAGSTLAVAVSAADVVVQVRAVDASKFPVLAYGDVFPARIKDDAGNYEFVLATDRADNMITVTRAQEGTTAKAFAAGSRFELDVTAGTWERLAESRWVRPKNAAGDVLLPTRVDAASFTLAGDLTMAFVPNRALHLVQTSSAYGHVLSSAYAGGLTTVTVQDCVVDAGLSLVELGLEVNASPKYANAANADTLGGSSKTQVVAEARNGTAANSALFAGKSESEIIAEARFGLDTSVMQQWTTATRPVGAVGKYGFNTTVGEPEWWDDVHGRWMPFGDNVSYVVDYLVVAGGGGAGGTNTGQGSYIGGGGGAGGVLAGSMALNYNQAYAITVGSGGAHGTNSGSPTAGTNGGNSSIAALVVALGGGGGGLGYNGGNGVAGGSGGGGGSNAGTGAAGTSGQGYRGGDSGGSQSTSGGGGGSSAVGAPNTGGAGTSSSISGSAVTYAAGGGTNVSGAINAAANTGNGGPAGNANMGGLNGGSGIVIISYPGAQRGSGGAYAYVNGRSIHTLTSSDTYVA